MNYKLVSVLLVLALLVFGCGKKEEAPKMAEAVQPQFQAPPPGIIKDYESPDVLKPKLRKFADVEIKYDPSNLTDKEKQALLLLVKAAQVMDDIYYKQVYAKNPEIKAALEKWVSSEPLAKPVLDMFKLYMGPFDRLEGDKPFINKAELKPAGANFYPADMTKEEFEAHIKANPADKEAFTSLFTVINRKDGKLVAVPFPEAYKADLEKAAQYLKDAAQLIDNPSLKKYLLSRADAFFSNDYYQSDVDWMDLKDSKIEIVIGPYEVYEDALYNYKAAYEAYISIVDPVESNKLSKIAKYLDDLERNHPVDNKYKNFKRGASSPILVVNQVYVGGQGKAGVQTTAFNLPNDENVREKKGSKKIMLKNVSDAKFNKSLLPIASRVLSPEDFKLVSFEAYFDFVLMHEVSHGLGPGNIVVNGVKTTVGKEMKELSSSIEEAKADILGVYNCEYLTSKGIFPKELEKTLMPSYLAGCFRSIRFGVTEDHAIGTLIQMNFLMEKGGFVYNDSTGTFHVDPDKIKGAVKQLAKELLEIEGSGDYARAKVLIEKYGKPSPAALKALEKLADIPTDIFPIYAIEAELK